jgi:superfamily II DNA/RNA helicase
LVATDIAARGIHVDEVGLVVHADPPTEHKAYLHRSGRTARAGASGTVVTMMLDAQVSDVRDLTRRAGIKPTITRVSPGHQLLQVIAPGERTFVAPEERPTPAAGTAGGGSRRRGGSRRGRSANRSGAAGSGGRRSGGRSTGKGGESSTSANKRSGAAGGSTGTKPRAHSAAAFSSSTRAR